MLMDRWSLGSFFFGMACWLSLVVWAPASMTFGLLGQLFLFAPLVVVPLVLRLVRISERNARESHLHQLLVLFQPFAAVAVLLSFFLPTGTGSAVLASVWAALVSLMAVFGLFRFLSRRSFRAEETCIDVGLVYFAVGGVWIVVSRMGVQPLGFTDIIVLLTAVHFHFAGGSLQILAGLTGRALLKQTSSSTLPWRIYRASLIGVIFGPPLLAAGITLSPLLEWLASLLLATGVVLLGSVFFLLFREAGVLSRILFSLAFASVMVTMTFAGIYAYGEWTGRTFLSINYMAEVHGVGNALGFVFCGLLAIWRMTPTVR